MSNIQIESDIKDILNKIDSKIDKLDEKFTQKIDKINENITELKVGQTEIKGEIKVLEEKIQGIDNRVKNQEFLNRGILASIFVAILLGLAKMFGLVGNS